jgi:Ca-activated chloride channel family protein
LYEVVPLKRARTVPETQTANVAGEAFEPLFTAMLQLNTPRKNSVAGPIQRSVSDAGFDFAAASSDLKFAAAVAEFGMILRDSEYKGNGSLQQVLEWAQQGKGADANGYRADFIELVRKAQALKKS